MSIKLKKILFNTIVLSFIPISLIGWGFNKELNKDNQFAIKTVDEPESKPFDFGNSEITQLALGETHSGAVVKDETGTDQLYMWGANDKGQLGNGGKDFDVNTPIDITAIFGQELQDGSKITHLALGVNDSGAVVETTNPDNSTTDQLYMWGANDKGQLGNNDLRISTETSKPIDITAIEGQTLPTGSKITHLALGQWCSGAVVKNEDGTDHLWMWGDNEYGQLGNGKTGPSTNPKPMDITSGNAGNDIRKLNSNEEITRLALGENHSGAVVKDGNGADHLWMWGRNREGQLGNGDSNALLINKPTDITSLLTNGAGIPGKITHLALGGDHSGVVIRDLDELGQEHLLMWGDNSLGQLGNGGKDSDVNTPIDITAISGQELQDGSKITHLALGSQYSGAVVKDGNGADHLYMWGFNNLGQLGNGESNWWTSKPSPIDITAIEGQTLPTGSKITHLALGQWCSGAVVKDKNGVDYLYMWGFNMAGQLGNGESNLWTSNPNPIKIAYTTRPLPLVASNLLLYIIIGFLLIILILAIILTIYSVIKEIKRNKRLSQ